MVELLQLKKTKANDAFKTEMYQVAYNLYSEALQIDPQNTKINAKLHYNKATACAKVRPMNNVQ